MFRIAIVEDDTSCAEQLEEYLRRYRRETGEELEVCRFSDGLELVEGYRPIYDLVLLDIEMPHLDGMTAARKIREADSEVLLLFITNMAKYAISGYEVEALGFMLKPVNYFALSLKLKKAFSYLHSRASKCLMIPTAEGVRKISSADVRYVEVLDHRLHFYTQEGTYVMRGTLHEVEAELEGQHFVRCNKGYLVNLRHIQLIRGDSVVMSGGDELLISRRRKDEFLLAVTVPSPLSVQIPWMWDGP